MGQSYEEVDETRPEKRSAQPTLRMFQIIGKDRNTFYTLAQELDEAKLTLDKFSEGAQGAVPVQGAAFVLPEGSIFMTEADSAELNASMTELRRAMELVFQDPTQEVKEQIFGSFDEIVAAFQKMVNSPRVQHMTPHIYQK